MSTQHAEANSACVEPTKRRELIDTCDCKDAAVFVQAYGLYRQLSRDGNWHGSGISFAMTASPKPSLVAPWTTLRWQRKWWVDKIRVWTSLPVPERLTMTSHRRDGKRMSAESSFMFPTPPPDVPIGQGTEVNGLCRCRGGPYPSSIVQPTIWFSDDSRF